VAGAIFSGFGMVLTLLIPVRKIYNLKNLITPRHLDNMCKIILATGSMVGLAYVTEFFIAWYSQNPYEFFTFWNRAFGPYWWAYWAMFSCNVISPQLFWFRVFRTNTVLMWIVCIFVNIGMWFERFVIACTSLSRDFLPSSWGYFSPTWVDIGMLVGSFGLFTTLFLLFCRYLPIVAISEVKGILSQEMHAAHHHSSSGHH
ncbi:MAG: hydrogenase, partial [Planctomycetales bacterium]|nr:hydrogenase [Planctomycetales bacterium]